MCEVTVGAVVGYDFESGRPRGILVRGTATDCPPSGSDQQGPFSTIGVEVQPASGPRLSGTVKLREGESDWMIAFKTDAVSCGDRIDVGASCLGGPSACRFSGPMTVTCSDTCRDVDIVIRDDGCDVLGRRRIHATADVQGPPWPVAGVDGIFVIWLLNDGSQTSSAVHNNQTEVDLLLSNDEIAADNVTFRLSENCPYRVPISALQPCDVPPAQSCPPDFSLAVTRNAQAVDTSGTVIPGPCHISIVSPPAGATSITWWDNKLRLDGGQEVVESTIDVTPPGGGTSIDYNLPTEDRRHRITAKAFISPQCIPVGSVTLRPTIATRTDPDPVTEVKPCPELGGIDVKGCAPGEVALTATGFSLERAVSWEWDFGDGQTLVGGRTVTHPYGERREFTAKVAMKRPAECNPATETMTATVPRCSDPDDGPPSIAFVLCGLWLLFILFCMIVGAILFPVGFCVMVDASFTGWGFVIGLIIFLIGAALLIAAAFMLMEWLRICGVIPEVCELVQLLWEVLGVLTLISGVAAVVVTALLQWCGLPVFFDAAYFAFFTALVLWFSRAIGCDLVPRWFRRILRWLGFA